MCVYTFGIVFLLQYITIYYYYVFIVPWSTGHRTTPRLYSIIVSADNRNELKSLSFESIIVAVYSYSVTASAPGSVGRI